MARKINKLGMVISNISKAVLIGTMVGVAVGAALYEAHPPFREWLDENFFQHEEEEEGARFGYSNSRSRDWESGQQEREQDRDYYDYYYDRVHGNLGRNDSVLEKKRLQAGGAGSEERSELGDDEKRGKKEKEKEMDRLGNGRSSGVEVSGMEMQRIDRPPTPPPRPPRQFTDAFEHGSMMADPFSDENGLLFDRDQFREEGTRSREEEYRLLLEQRLADERREKEDERAPTPPPRPEKIRLGSIPVVAEERSFQITHPDPIQISPSTGITTQSSPHSAQSAQSDQNWDFATVRSQDTFLSALGSTNDPEMMTNDRMDSEQVLNSVHDHLSDTSTISALSVVEWDSDEERQERNDHVNPPRQEVQRMASTPTLSVPSLDPSTRPQSPRSDTSESVAESVSLTSDSVSVVSDYLLLDGSDVEIDSQLGGNRVRTRAGSGSGDDSQSVDSWESFDSQESLQAA